MTATSWTRSCALRGNRDDSSPQKQSQETQDPGWSQTASLREALGSGEIFCMDAMAKTFVDTMGVLRTELFWFCAVGRHDDID